MQNVKKCAAKCMAFALLCPLVCLAEALPDAGEETSRTVYGSGTVQSVHMPAVYAASEATVRELLVSPGDAVKAGDVVAVLANDSLAQEIEQLEYDLQIAQQAVQAVKTHEQLIQRPLYDEDGDLRYDPNTGEVLTGTFSNEVTIYAPVSGRLMALYIAPGDDALAVYRARGSVAVISTDGRMKVELSDLAEKLNIGDTVLVQGEGMETEGTVVSLARRGTQAVVQVIGDDHPLDFPVTVSTKEGKVLGFGVLTANKPMTVSAYGGTIKGIAVSVGQMIEQNDVIARIAWSDVPLYLDNAKVLRDYAKAQALLNEAIGRREALTLVAPCDGVVADTPVQAGDTVQKGTLLMSFVEDDAGMELILAVDELDILGVSPGQNVQLSVDALPNAVLTGTVEKIAPLGNLSSGVTRYDVYVALNEQDDRVLSGMNVSGEIEVDASEKRMQ